MVNSMMIQELNDNQLEMVVGGISFKGIVKKVKKAAAKAVKATAAGVTLVLSAFVPIGPVIDIIKDII